MSTDQVEQLPVEVDDWNGLYQYTQLLSQGSDEKIKICMIDEEQEEIRLQNKDEFDLNVKYAQDHGIKSLTLVVYIDGKHVFNGIYRIEKVVEKKVFPVDKLQILLDNVLTEKWYIPVKQDEAFGICLTAAITLAQENKLDTIVECKKFIETIVPEAFRKLQNTPSVYSWPREIQCGIFELIELLIDLVGIRLRFPPVPITLLNTLAMAFDTNTTFSQKHKNELLPTRRVYTLKGDFLRDDFDTETFGWLRSIIQRFIAQNGLTNIRLQFEYIDSSNSTTAALEYNALLKLFAKCQQCISSHRFRAIFIRPIRHGIISKLRDQIFRAKIAIQYLKSTNEINDELKELNETLLDICQKYELKDEMNKLCTLSSNSNVCELSSPTIETCSEITPLIEIPNSVQRKSKNQDCYERLAEDIRSMTMNSNDVERKNIKKQRTDEQMPTPLFTRNNLLDCIDELLTSTDKRSLKRKHRREQQRSTLTSINTGHINKKENKRSNTTTTAISLDKTYDRSNPEDILRYFAPMKIKIATLYDNLQTATSHGHLREILKIEEKLKLLHPFSARFIADENTPDGTSMKPGQVFRKGWILLNDGSMPWDSNDIQLINLSNGIEVLQQPIVPITAPHARAVITVDYKCAYEPGTYESKWILTYRQQTFGPMIWCSIQVNHSSIIENKIQSITNENLLNEFEFIDVPLPACFDLSKPFQPDDSSLRSSFILSRSDSIELTSTYFNTLDLDNLPSPTITDSDSLSNSIFSPLITPQINEASVENPITLIELPPPTTTIENPIPVVSNNEERQSIRLSPSLDFVDTVVTNIFSVAKQAGSTAKAIFNTLQAFDEPIPPITPPVQEQQTILINTSFNTNQTNANGFIDHIEENPTTTTSVTSISSNDPMKTLIEMGFANRARNQRLLKENANDLAKVIELLTLDNNEDVDSFIHRH